MKIAILSTLVLLTISACGRHDEAGQISAAQEELPSTITAALTCDDLIEGLKVRLGVVISGTQFGITVVGSRHTSDGPESVLGSDGVRVPFTRSILLESTDLCKSDSQEISLEKIDTVVQKNISGDFSWRESKVNSTTVVVEVYKPATWLRGERVIEKIDLATREKSGFKIVTKEAKVNGIGSVEVR